MIKRILILIEIILVVIMISITALAVTNISINIGDYIQLGTYYGEPILWRCVDIDKNGPLMLSDKIICIKPFDASGDNTSGSHNGGHYRQENGSNYWSDSNIRSWLNSTASSGNIVWLCGNAPDEEHVVNGYNAYDQEAGFLTNFSTMERKAIKTVLQKSIVAYPEYSKNMYDTGIEAYKWESDIRKAVSNYDNAYAEDVQDNIFLLDVKQVNAVYKNSNVLGKDYYIGEPTEKCVENSSDIKFLQTGKKYHYWLRTPLTSVVANDYCSLPCLVSSGDISFICYADGSSIGVRPAFYLDTSSNIFNIGDGTIKKPYTIKNSNLLLTLIIVLITVVVLVCVIYSFKSSKYDRR